MPESNYFEKFMLNSKDQIIMPGSNRISPEDLIRMQFQYSWEELQKMDFNPFMFSINDNDGKRLREFGQKKIFDEMRMNNLGNRYYDAIDKEDNFYVSFEVQNRIEKYSRQDKRAMDAQTLLNRTRRELNGGHYRDAAGHARDVIRKYPDLPQAGQARSILDAAEFEAPIKQEIERARGAVNGIEWC